MESSTERTDKPLTDVGFWQSVWEREVGKGVPVVQEDAHFDRVLSRHLPKGNLDAIEIGFYPGSYMVYLSRRFGYRVSGLDFMPDVERMRKPLEAAGARVGELLQADFMKLETDKTFDVVASFGFVEHFENLDAVMSRHAKLVRPGGYLVVQVPHFKGIHYWLRKTFEPDLLAAHNLGAMSPRWYRAWYESHGFEPLYCDYFRTFDFWFSSSAHVLEERFAPRHRLVAWTTRLARIGLRTLHLEHVPNRWFSPFVVTIAKRRG
jgi:SAM-dependent methyltransferase